MGFQFQKFSNYGTSTPAVARTVVQASQLMQAFPISEDIRVDVRNALFEVQKQLVRCVQLWEQIRDKVEKGKGTVCRQRIKTQAGGRAATLPGVADLDTQAESFLQAAKLAIRDVATTLTPFFGTSFDHRFDKILSLARQRFSEDDELVKCLVAWEPWVKQIVTMRNAVDHPRDVPGGRLVVQNFRLTSTDEGAVLREPSWCLSGGEPSNIVHDMENIIEGILRLSEDLLAICLLKNRGGLPLFIYEIPEEERDPKCPIRLRVSTNLPAPGG